MRTAQQRDALLFRFKQQIIWRVKVLGDDKTADIEGAELNDVILRLGRIALEQFREVAELGGAEHLDAVWVKIFGVSGQGQSRLLDSGHLDKSAEASLTGQKLQVKPGLCRGQQF